MMRRLYSVVIACTFLAQGGTAAPLPSEVASEVTFVTAEPAPVSFVNWTFFWFMPEIDPDAELDYVVSQPDGKEYFRYKIGYKPAGYAIRSDFPPGLAKTPPNVFFGRPVTVTFRVNKGSITFEKGVTFAFEAAVKEIQGVRKSQPVYNPANGHYYSRADAAVDWHKAKALAQQSEYLGVAGHLATVTSEEENTWIKENVGGRLLLDHWLGGYEQAGQWKWVTGEPFDYTHWWPGEPSSEQEDALQYDDDESGKGPCDMWNDCRSQALEDGYIVEYEGAFQERLKAGE